MKKSDLKTGMIVILKNGEMGQILKGTACGDFIKFIDTNGILDLGSYNNDLNHRLGNKFPHLKDYDIMEVYDPLNANCNREIVKKGGFNMNSVIIQYRVLDDKNYSIIARIFNPEKKIYEHPSLINLTKETCFKYMKRMLANPPCIQEVEANWTYIGD